MQHVKPILIEVLMNGKLQAMAQAEHRIEGARAETQMGLLAQKLHRVPLHLDGVHLRICIAEDLQRFDLYFRSLALSLAFDQGAYGRNGGPRREALSQGLIGVVPVDHQLQIGQTGSVVDGEELVIPESPDPSTNGHLLACEGGVEQLRNRVALHFGVF